MARKRSIFLSYLQSLLKFVKSGQLRRRLLLIILGVLVACGVHIDLPRIGLSPVVAQVPMVQPRQGDSSLVQQAKELYDAGQFLEAAKLLQQAASAYEAQGDRLNQARVLSQVSLAYQQLGQWEQAKKAIADSLQLLQTAPGNSTDRLKILAQALNTQGSLQLALGQSEQALDTWQQATTNYIQIGDRTGVIRSQINQAQAMRALGLYRRALTTLTQVNETLQKQPDSQIKATGLRSLGSTFLLVGDLEQSQQLLQQSLDLAQRLNSPQDIGATLFVLGNLARTQQNTKAALDFYQQAATVSPSIKIRAQLNQLSLLIDQQEWAAAQILSTQIQSQIVNLPPTRSNIYAKLNFAHSLTSLQQINSPNTVSGSEIAQMLATTVREAKSLGDRRAEAYALGSLGGLYEQTQQWSDAQDLTQQALLLAQAINAPDIAYRWQWQLGRLLKFQGDRQRAIAAYSEAVNSLKSLRSDLVAINQDIQFSFRESVEPVYRELVSLLLDKSELRANNKDLSSTSSISDSQSSSSIQNRLAQARDVIESLQIAELDNFFKEACLDTQETEIDRLDPEAAIIYPIILPDRLEVIISLPQQPLRHYATNLSKSEVEKTVKQLRQTLLIRSKLSFMPFAQEVYNWLIRPAEKDLANSRVKTLVFVLDGSLRNIPMAALNDGKQYLLEKYSVALTPSLKLANPNPIQNVQLRALTAGLTEATQGFSSLDNVALELQEIKSQIPSTILLNKEFTTLNFEKEIESASFPIVHLATHGKFSSKAVETYIITWNSRINVNELDNLLQVRGAENQNAIELLVLSACETASGDDRAALGIAGVAVRAGARSTLATLWSVDDAGTADLMRQFYQELAKTSVTKAESLRLAQLSLLRNPLYKHPIYWAPYVLLGNWL